MTSFFFFCYLVFCNYHIINLSLVVFHKIVYTVMTRPIYAQSMSVLATLLWSCPR